MAGRDAERREPDRVTQVTYALKWIGGQELGRAGRDREADIAAAGSAVWPEESLAAPTIEARLRRCALALARDELTRTESAILQVLVREKDIGRLAEAEDPPWQLVDAQRRQRIGPLRDGIATALALTLGGDKVTKRDQFRRQHENPVYDRVARAIVGGVDAAPSDSGDQAEGTPHVGLPTPVAAYRAINRAADRADAMMLAPKAPTEARIEEWLLEWNAAYTDVELVGSPAVIRQISDLISIYDRVAASFELSDDPNNPYSEVQDAYMALREEIRRKRGEIQSVMRRELEHPTR